jgi:hypothetical protein
MTTRKRSPAGQACGNSASRFNLRQINAYRKIYFTTEEESEWRTLWEKTISRLSNLLLFPAYSLQDTSARLRSLLSTEVYF